MNRSILQQATIKSDIKKEKIIAGISMFIFIVAFIVFLIFMNLNNPVLCFITAIIVVISAWVSYVASINIDFLEDELDMYKYSLFSRL